MKILLIGTGATEQLLAESLARSAHAPEVVCLTTYLHPGLRRAASSYLTIPTMHAVAVEGVIAEQQPEIVVIGPSVCDMAVTAVVEASGIPYLGPTATTLALARPAIPRQLLGELSLPGNPLFTTFAQSDEVDDALRMEAIRDALTDCEEGFAIQSDDPWGTPAESGEEVAGIADGTKCALRALREMGRVTIDERMAGLPFSMFFASDGETLVAGSAYERYARINDGEHGPVTPGVGVAIDALGRPAWLTSADIAAACTITEDVLRRFRVTHDVPVRGIFAGDFRLTRAGVELVRYRAGWGDPDTLALLPLLQADLVDLAQGIARGELSDASLSCSRRAAVVKYLYPVDYPRLALPDVVVQAYGMPPGCRLAFDAVRLLEDGTLRTTGGRIAALTGVADTLDEAEALAESGVARIAGDLLHRRDIGTELATTTRILAADRLRSSSITA